MKKLIYSVLLISMISTSATAATGTAERKSRISNAADWLTDVAESVSPLQLTPGEIKLAMHDLAVKEQGMSEEEFEENWLADDSDAWAADSGAWGFDTAAGARAYIEGVLHENLDQGEKTDEEKIKYADAMISVERAFSLIGYDKTIQYGVAPMGAVQCGVTFAELIIVDTKTGEAYEVVMEGSGC